MLGEIGDMPKILLKVWLMLQQEEADDYVLATGIQASVRDFTELAFAEAGINLKWEGDGERKGHFQGNRQCARRN